MEVYFSFCRIKVLCGTKTLFSENWGYPSDNSAWGCVCESSDSQSPIDLPDLTTAIARDDPLELSFEENTKLIGFDSGHSLEWVCNI